MLPQSVKIFDNNNSNVESIPRCEIASKSIDDEIIENELTYRRNNIPSGIDEADLEINPNRVAIPLKL